MDKMSNFNNSDTNKKDLSKLKIFNYKSTLNELVFFSLYISL